MAVPYDVDSGSASILLPRQAVITPSSSSSSTSSGYDHRWLLFLIPIILLFFGLIFAVWFILRKRRRAKRRKSVLRNRSLVVAEKEKQREKEERKLSRGDSLSSKLSRMTSTKSNLTKSTSQKGKVTSKYRKSDGHSRYGSSSTQSHSTEAGGAKSSREGEEQPNEKDSRDIVEEVNPSDGLDRIQLVDGGWTEQVEDLEYQAESEAAMVIGGAEAGPRVKIAEEAKPSRPYMSSRKELSVIGETGVGEEAGGEEEGEAESSNARVTREGSQRSTSGRASSTGHYAQSSSSNPFASPVESSNNNHFVESPSTPITSATTSEEGGNKGSGVPPSSSSGSGLGRKLSGVIRLRQPSPSPKVQRSDSRASRKSSTKSIRRTDSPSSLAGQGGGAAALPISGSWTYTSKAAQWKSSSTDVTAPSATEDTSVDVPVVKVQDTEKNEFDAGQEKVVSNQQEEQSNNLTPSSSSGPPHLVRKTSTGVAGSRFVESFDD